MKGLSSEMLLTIGILIASGILLLQLRAVFYGQQRIGEEEVVVSFVNDLESVLDKSLSSTGEVNFSYKPLIKKYMIDVEDNTVTVHDKISGENFLFVKSGVEIVPNHIEDSEEVYVKKIEIRKRAIYRSYAKDGFVEVSGNKLLLNGGEFKFVGVNFHSLSYLSSQKIDDVISYLSEECGVNVIRMWGFPKYGIDNVEKVLDVGSKYPVKFIIALEDFPYGPPEPDPGHWFRDGYKSEYKPYVINIVSKFKDRQEILAWELINEPHCKADVNCVNNLYNFVVDISDTIKSLDQNHIVSIGTMGLNHLGERISNDEYKNLHSTPSVDIASGHYSDEENIQKGYMYTEIDIADSINKPFYIGEAWLKGHDSGCGGDGSCTSCDCTNVCSRDELLRRKSRLDNEMDEMFNRGTDGYLVWQYSLERNPITICDPFSFFRGDPICDALKEKSNKISTMEETSVEKGYIIYITSGECLETDEECYHSVQCCSGYCWGDSPDALICHDEPADDGKYANDTLACLSGYLNEEKECEELKIIIPPKSYSEIQLGWPTDIKYVTSCFGLRKSMSDFHKGVDIRANQNSPVYAPADGVFHRSFWSDSAGNVLEIEHVFGDKNYYTVYYHLNQILIKEGTLVHEGDVIALSGNTGSHTIGAHLHIGIRNDRWEYFDPCPYFKDTDPCTQASIEKRDNC